MRGTTTQSIFQTSVHKSSWRSYAMSMSVHAGLAALAFAVVVPAAMEVRKLLDSTRAFDALFLHVRLGSSMLSHSSPRLFGLQTAIPKILASSLSRQFRSNTPVSSLSDIQALLVTESLRSTFSN
jgi:hypothetical protein